MVKSEHLLLNYYILLSVLLNTVKRLSIKYVVENVVNELQKLVGFGALAEFSVNTTFTACRCLHLALWIGSKLQVLPFVSECSCVVVAVLRFTPF